MILVSTDYVTGKELETISIVKGSTIRAKNLGRDIISALKMIVGGELKDYSNMINEARAIAAKRMAEEAEELGADAVVNIRYATSNVAKSAAEVLVYGTAVTFRKQQHLE